MLFDRPPSLPIATMRSTSRVATIASQLRGARADGWRWARPRLVPAAVALVGMLAMLGAGEYLTNLARFTPEQPAQVIEPVQPQIAASESPILIIEHGPPGAVILLDGNPIDRMFDLPAPRSMQIDPHRSGLWLVPAR